MKLFLNSTAFARSRAYACFFAVLYTFFSVFHSIDATAQVGSVTCNTFTPIVNPTFNNITVTSSQTLSLNPEDEFTAKGNVIDQSLTNSSHFEFGILGSGWLEVKDNTASNLYPIGSFAGFAIGEGALSSALGTVRITTYQGNTEQEFKQGTNLLSGGLATGVFKVGFYTTKTYDRIRITYTGVIAGAIDVYYPVIEKFCTASSPLICNTATYVASPNFPAIINTAHTGVTGVSLGAVSNPLSAVDSDPNNYAEINVLAGVSGNASLSVQEKLTDYDAGTYAGFDIQNTYLLQANLLGGIKISTYLDGSSTEQESVSGASLLSVGSSLLSSDVRQKIGFLTTKKFDEVRITLITTGISLGTTRVYGAVFQTFCAGPALVCNTPTSLTSGLNKFPVFVNGHNTGVSGLSIGTINNTDNVIDSDPATYAEFALVAGSGTASLSVQDAVTNYPAGTYAGFDIQNTSALQLSLLGGITISTYKDGGTTAQETFTGANLLTVGSSLLSGNVRQKVGFLTTKEFDEVKITVTSTGASLGTTRIYGVILEKFCAGPALVCNTPTSLTGGLNNFPVFVNGRNTGVSAVAIGSINNTDNVIDNDPATYAEFALVAGAGSASLSVQDAITNYPIGTYAGFDIQNTAALQANLLGGITISTYLNGSTTAQESFSGASLLSVGSTLLSGDVRQKIGFLATKEFDEVKITVTSVSVSLGTTRIYGVVLETFCAGPELVCNTPTHLTSGVGKFPVFIDGVNTGVSGISIGSVNNTDNAIDSDPATYAEIAILAGVGGSASLAIRDAKTTYPAGTFAGFDINSPALVGASVLGGLRISTYLNGVATGEFFENGSTAGASVPLLSGTGRQIVGFLTKLPFNEVKLTISQTVGVNVGTTQVFGVVLTRFCIADQLACNTLTTVTNPGSPVFVDGQNTGITSIACVACTVNNPEYVLDSDPANAATVILAAGVASTGTFAVANALETYAPTSFAGFDVETTTLLSAGALSNATISLYNDGALVQTGTGDALIVGAATSLLTGTSRQIVGLVATVAYDEVKISFQQLAGANLGNIKIYGAVFDKLCEGTIACNNSYLLTQPAFPVVINSARTGVSGAVCALCNVKDAWNVISDSKTDFAQVSVVANVGASASISVIDPISTYPIGTTAGFTIRNVNNLVELDLLNSITIETYNNGVLQETKAGGALLNLNLLNIVTVGTGTVISPSFVTTKPFDEIRISFAALASVVNVVNVYGAFVDTRGAIGGGALSCNVVTNPDFNVTQINVTVPGNVSTNDKVPAGTTYGTPTPGTNPAGATITLNADGSYTFVATTVGVYTYSVPVCIPGITPCGSAPLVITVTDPTKTTNKPVANTDIVTTVGAASSPAVKTINVRANDAAGNAGGTLGVPTAVTAPAHGTAVISGGNINYTPAAGYYGPDMFTYTVCETPGTDLCATATVYVTVTQPGATNTTSAADDYVSTAAGVTASGNVSTNDTDSEGNTQTVTAQNITNAKGTFSLATSGAFTFVPAAGVTGPVDFIYTTCDNGTPSACATATLYILVNPVITILTNPDFNVTQINVTVPGNVSTNDKVPTGTTYGTPTPGTNPAGATITMNADGSYTFVATTVGVYTYTVPVCVPGITPCGSAPLVITVTDPTKITNKPVANTDIAVITGAPTNPASVTINVKANDGPGNVGGTLGTPTPTTPAHGTVSVSGGNVVYTPTAGYYGEDMFTYTVCETPGTDLCATATVYVTVKQPGATNTTSATDDYVSTTAGVTATGNVSTNDTDPEGNTQTVTAQSVTNASGVFTLQTNGSFTFVPASGFTGPAEFIYTTCDGGTPAACASATLHIVVNPKMPDLVPTLGITPAQVIGNNKTINARVVVAEKNGVATTGNIFVRIPISSHYTINAYSSTLTSSAGLPVQNSQWSYMGISGSNYLFKYGGTAGLTSIGASGDTAFGFSLIYNSNNQSGTENIVVSIFDGSGGEINFLNNKDNENINFSGN